ncbi:MAG: PilZ domain-containing protein [Phycisphaerales bacterium]
MHTPDPTPVPEAPPTPAPAPQPEQADATAPRNRRRHERTVFVKPVWVSELNDRGEPGPVWKCRGVDLSRAGIGLRSRRHIHTGRLVILEVPGPEGAKRALFGIVRQSRYAEGEGYAVGIEFRDPPASDSVKIWMAERGLRA